MKRMWTLLAGVLAATLALTACSGTTRAPSSAGSTFTYAFHLNVVTEWDPAVSYSNESIAMANLYESLTRYDASTKKVEPLLATSWTKSADGRTWTFRLRDDVTFHTGRKLDSAAVKESIERTKKLAAGAAYIWDPVSSIETPDPTTVVFTLAYPVALDLIASSGYGAYIYDTQAAGGGDLGAWFKKAHDAGTGPYTVDTWTAGAETELRLKAYDDYWGGWTDQQYRAVEFRVTPEVTTAWQLLQRDDVSFVDRLTPQIYAQAGKTDGVATSETSSFQNLLALYNTQSGPMADLRVRRAIQMLTDTKAILSALHGAAAPADGLIPPGLIGEGDASVQPDPAAARRLLADAGYGPGHPLQLTLTYAQGDKDQALYVTLLGSALKQAGVQLDARPMQWDAQWTRGKSADVGQRQDIFVMYWYPDYADPLSWFVNLFKSAKEPYFNLAYLDDATVDAGIARLPKETAIAPAQAARSYLELQRRIVLDDAAVTPLYLIKYQRAYSADFTGYVDNPAYPNVVFVHDLRTK